MIANIFFKLFRYGLVPILFKCSQLFILILVIDMLTALKSYLEHSRKVYDQIFKGGGGGGGVMDGEGVIKVKGA